MTTGRFRGCAILASLALTAPALAAQSDADDWLAQCQRRDWSERPHACRIRETGMRPSGGALTVDPGQNGAIAVYGWDRDSIGVVAKVQADARSEEDARQVVDAVRIDAAGNTIRATGPEAARRQQWSVSFDVYVPRHTDLALTTENGPLSVSDVTGTMNLRAQNGPVSLTGVGGDITARVQNGPLSVRLSGTRWEGVGLDAEARNGPVDLAIPERYNAQLETGTVNGPMDVAFPLTVTVQGHVTDRIRTTLGAGGAPIRVVTTNGPLTIRRAR
jgi:putative adhesin